MTELFFLLLLVSGLLVLFSPSLRDGKQLIVFFLKTRIAEYRNEEGWNNLKREHFQKRLPEHIRLLLQTAGSMGTRKSVKAFLVISILLGCSVFFLTIWRISVLLAFLAGGAGSVLPYLLLRCLVQGKQIGGSQEGEVLVTELLSNYKIHYCNMVRAVEATAVTIEGAPYCRRLLLNLSRGLNRTAADAELKQLLYEFQYALGTSWAGILSTNMYLACSSGMKVTESMQDLAQSMKRARKIEEFLQRENNEVRMILQYMVPSGFLLLTAGGIHFFGLTPGEWFQNQFCSSAGIAWFLLLLLLYLTAVAVYVFLSVRKFDL